MTEVRDMRPGDWYVEFQHFKLIPDRRSYVYVYGAPHRVVKRRGQLGETAKTAVRVYEFITNADDHTPRETSEAGGADSTWTVSSGVLTHPLVHSISLDDRSLDRSIWKLTSPHRIHPSVLARFERATQRCMSHTDCLESPALGDACFEQSHGRAARDRRRRVTTRRRRSRR